MLQDAPADATADDFAGSASASCPAPLSSASPRFSAQERRQLRRLCGTLALLIVFFAIQFVGATLAGSDALRAEALHMLTDAAAIGMSLLAMRMATRPASQRFTFGLRRAEPIAAIINAVLVLGAVALLVVEAIEGLSSGEMPQANLMLLFAGLALVINGLSAWLIHGSIDPIHAREHGHEHSLCHAHDHAAKVAPPHHCSGPCEKGHVYVAGHEVHHAGGHSLSLRAVSLHLLGDALGALAAIVAAALIRVGFPAWIDAAAALFVAFILVIGASRLLREAILVLLEASPARLSLEEIRSTMRACGAVRIDELHTWTLGGGHDALMAHVQLATTEPDGAPQIVGRMADALRNRFGLAHIAIQLMPLGTSSARDSAHSRAVRGAWGRAPS